MKYSEIACKVVAAKECGIIKSNAQFWSNFSDKKKFEEVISNNSQVLNTTEKLHNEFNVYDDDEGVICAFDDTFPVINKNVKNNSDKPYLLFYKGDLTLLQDLNKNVAVIGLIEPDEEIIRRETEVVKSLVRNDLVIVSGLANGCDTVAHKVCLEMNGKTIAILPSQINKVYPSDNRKIAEKIVEKGGLLISEYYKEPMSKREAISRFIERDRLQAMFAKAILLVASYRKGEGDSGSRHAMEAARKFQIERYVMYKSKTDENNKRFGLNKDLIDVQCASKARILHSSSIDYIKALENKDLCRNTGYSDNNQLTFL